MRPNLSSTSTDSSEPDPEIRYGRAENWAQGRSVSASLVLDADHNVQMVSPSFETLLAHLQGRASVKARKGAAGRLLKLSVHQAEEVDPIPMDDLIDRVRAGDAECIRGIVLPTVTHEVKRRLRVRIEAAAGAGAWVQGPPPHIAVHFSLADGRAPTGASRQEAPEWDDVGMLFEHQALLSHRFLPDTTELTVNDAYAELFGLAPDVIEGTRWIEHVDPRHREQIRSMLDSLTPEAPRSTFENEVIDAHRQSRWIRWYNQAIFDEAGEVEYYQSIGIDLTGQKLVEESLRENQSRFYQIARNIDEAFWLRTRTDMLYVNPAFETIWGVPRDRIYEDAFAFLDVVHPDDRDRVRKTVRDIYNNNQEGRLQYRVVHTDGDVRWVRVHIRPTYTSGVQPRFVGVGRDITETERARRIVQESEERFRALAEQTTDFISRHDSNATYLYASPSSKRLMGRTPGELIGRDASDFIHPEDRASVREQQRQMLEGNRVQFEYRLRHKDGEYVWVETTGRILEEDGSVEIIASTRNIDERKRTEQVLRESRQQFQALAENVSDVVMRSDTTGQVIWISPSVEAVFGRTPEAARAIPTWSILHPDDHEAALEFHAALMRGEEPPPFLHRARHADGHYIWVEALARPIFDEDGNVLNIQTSVRDVTDRVERNQQLQAAMEEAEEAERLKSAMLANMSHEVRTPMTSILGFAELLKDATDGEPHKFASLIYRSSERLLRTLDSVLQLSKLEAGSRGLREEYVDVSAHAREVVEEHALKAQEFGIDLTLDIPDEVAVGMWDADAIRRILVNLVENALKFTDEEGHVTVRVLNVDAGANVEIQVKDDGIGMSEAFQAQMFQAFKQESEGMSRSHEGSGLGLAIVERLVDLIEGSIRVDSVKGEGTTITVRFPRDLET